MPKLRKPEQLIKPAETKIMLVEHEPAKRLSAQDKYSGALDFMQTLAETMDLSRGLNDEKNKKNYNACYLLHKALEEILKVRETEEIKNFTFPPLESLPKDFFDALTYLAAEEPKIYEQCTQSNKSTEENVENNHNPIFLALQEAIKQVNKPPATDENPHTTKRRGDRIGKLSNLAMELPAGMADRQKPLPIDLEEITTEEIAAAATELLLRLEEEAKFLESKELKDDAETVAKFLRVFASPKSGLARLEDNECPNYEALLRKMNSQHSEFGMLDLPKDVYEAALNLKINNPRLNLAFLGHDIEAGIVAHEVGGNPFNVAAVASQERFEGGDGGLDEFDKLDEWLDSAKLKEAENFELVLARVGANLLPPKKEDAALVKIWRTVKNPREAFKKWREKRGDKIVDRYIAQEIAQLKIAGDAKNFIKFEKIITTLVADFARKKIPARPDLMEAIVGVAAKLSNDADPSYAEYLQYLHDELYKAIEGEKTKRQKELCEAIKNNLHNIKNRVIFQWQNRFTEPEVLYGYHKKTGYKRERNGYTGSKGKVLFNNEFVSIFSDNNPLNVYDKKTGTTSVISSQEIQTLFAAEKAPLAAAITPEQNKIILRFSSKIVVLEKTKKGAWSITKKFDVSAPQDDMPLNFKLLMTENSVMDNEGLTNLASGERINYRPSVSFRARPVRQRALLGAVKDHGIIAGEFLTGPAQLNLHRPEKDPVTNEPRQYEFNPITKFKRNGYIEIFVAPNQILAHQPNENESEKGDIKLITFRAGSNEVSDDREIILPNDQTICQLLPDSRLITIDDKTNTVLLQRFVTKNNNTEAIVEQELPVTDGKNVNARMTPDGKIYVTKQDGGIEVFDGEAEPEPSLQEQLTLMEKNINSIIDNLPSREEAEKIITTIKETDPQRVKWQHNLVIPDRVKEICEHLRLVITAGRQTLNYNNYDIIKNVATETQKEVNKLALASAIAWQTDIDPDTRANAHNYISLCNTGLHQSIESKQQGISDAYNMLTNAAEGHILKEWLNSRRKITDLTVKNQKVDTLLNRLTELQSSIITKHNSQNEEEVVLTRKILIRLQLILDNEHRSNYENFNQLTTGAITKNQKEKEALFAKHFEAGNVDPSIFLPNGQINPAEVNKILVALKEPAQNASAEINPAISAALKQRQEETARIIRITNNVLAYLEHSDLGKQLQRGEEEITEIKKLLAELEQK